MVKISPLSIPFVRWHSVPRVDTAGYDLSGKSVLLIGGCSGIGYEISRQLARLSPAVLIITGRNPTVGEAVVSELRHMAAQSTVEFIRLDLEVFASVKDIVSHVSERCSSGLDLLICNSGMLTHTYALTVDGWESGLQVNHLSLTLLTLLLLPVLSKSQEPRIVFTTSDAHGMIDDTSELLGENVLHKLSDKDYCASNKKTMQNRYSITKMFNIFAVRALSSRLSHITRADNNGEPKFTVVSANPGFTQSALLDEMGKYGVVIRLILALMIWMCARTTEEGSRTILHAALVPPSKSINGKYFSNGRVEEEGDFVISKEGRSVEKVVWDETIDILSSADSRIPEIVKTYL